MPEELIGLDLREFGMESTTDPFGDTTAWFLSWECVDRFWAGHFIVPSDSIRMRRIGW